MITTSTWKEPCWSPTWWLQGMLVPRSIPLSKWPWRLSQLSVALSLLLFLVILRCLGLAGIYSLLRKYFVFPQHSQESIRGLAALLYVILRQFGWQKDWFFGFNHSSLFVTFPHGSPPLVHAAHMHFQVLCWETQIPMFVRPNSHWDWGGQSGVTTPRCYLAIWECHIFLWSIPFSSVGQITIGGAI